MEWSLRLSVLQTALIDTHIHLYYECSNVKECRPIHVTDCRRRRRALGLNPPTQENQAVAFYCTVRLALDSTLVEQLPITVTPRLSSLSSNNSAKKYAFIHIGDSFLREISNSDQRLTDVVRQEVCIARPRGLWQPGVYGIIWFHLSAPWGHVTTDLWIIGLPSDRPRDTMTLLSLIHIWPWKKAMHVGRSDDKTVYETRNYETNSHWKLVPFTSCTGSEKTERIPKRDTSNITLILRIIYRHHIEFKNDLIELSLRFVHLFHDSDWFY